MPSKDTYIRPPFNLDPFLLLDDGAARTLYGWEESLEDINQVSPWVLLAINMYGILTGESKRQGGSAGEREPKAPGDVRKPGKVSLRNWAFAFNTAVKNQYENSGLFMKPNNVDKEDSQDKWSPPIKLNSGDPGDGPGGKPRKKLNERWLWIKRGPKKAVYRKILSVINSYRLDVRKLAINEFGAEELLK